jgi:hypothetical protein
MIFNLLLILNLAFFVFIIFLVRSRKISEQQSLIWLFVGLVTIVSIIFRHELDKLAHYLGVDYAPSLFFALAFLFLLLLNINLTINLYKALQRTKKLTQEMALLKNKVEKK